jgi:sporulation protein YlmC with PRC-barrel domain
MTDLVSHSRASSAALEAATALYGCLVRDRSGQVAGSIADLIVDLRGGSIAYAVLASGGFLGVGERRFTVPWTWLRSDGAEFVLGVSRSTLDDAAMRQIDAT